MYETVQVSRVDKESSTVLEASGEYENYDSKPRGTCTVSIYSEYLALLPYGPGRVYNVTIPLYICITTEICIFNDCARPWSYIILAIIVHGFFCHAHSQVSNSVKAITRSIESVIIIRELSQHYSTII